MKYAVITFLGGEKKIFFLADLFVLERDFKSVIRLEIKEVPKEILEKKFQPLFSLEEELWKYENYKEGKK